MQDSNLTTNPVPFNSVINIPNPVSDYKTPNRFCPTPSDLGWTNLNVNYPIQIPEQGKLDSELQDNSDWLDSHITTCLFNTRSIVRKLSDLQSFIHSSNFEVVEITESWLSSDIYNNEILQTNYLIYHNDHLS